MRCPVCRTEMLIMESSGVEIDHCLTCRGVWLDEGELELLVRGAHERERLFSSLGVAVGSRERAYPCPACGAPMRKMNIGTTDQIPVDICAHRHGIWFDQGELSRVVRMGDDENYRRIATMLGDMFGEKTAG